jgi:cell division transport system permease protein
MRHHREAIADALRRLAASPFATLLTALAVGVALGLPATGQMLLANVQRLTREVSAVPQITVFMQVEADRAAADAVAGRLREMDGLGRVQFVSREDTAARLAQSEGLGEVLAALPANPFPDAFVITPAALDAARFEVLKKQFEQLPQVDEVQLDSAWTEKLAALLELGQRAVLLLGALLGVALVAVSFNTIRLQTLTRREEIAVSRLLGATDDHIRRPFDWFGALQGLAGGLVAWAIVWGVAGQLSEPVRTLAGLYSLDFRLQPLGAPETTVLLAGAAVLGWLGARLSLSRFLRQTP